MPRSFHCLLVLSLSLIAVHATPLLQDSFPYAAGTLNGQGAWTGGSGSQVAAGSLAYPGLESHAVTSNKVSLPSTASTAQKTFSANIVTSGSIYLSFILKQITLSGSTAGGTLAGLDDDGSFTTSNGKVAAALGIHIKQTNTTSYLVGIRKGQGASGAGGGSDVFYTGDSFTTGDVVFIVAKYTFGPAAGDDAVTLWVNPPTNSFAGSEPVASVAATTTANTEDASGLQYVFVRCNSSTTSGINELDELRVGTAWADVTPNGGATPPAPVTIPVITQAQLTPAGIALRGTNGTPGAVYQVLAATNITLPFSNWPPIAAHTFDPAGNFDETNSVAPGLPQQFFRLLVGGTIPPAPAAPSITTEPTNQTVTAGQSASFTVVASGSAPLSYQWYFNSNTILSNATNASLTIINAQATNGGGYSVRVTNSAGSVTSVVATLTVNAAAPFITMPPQSQTVTASNNATFTVMAGGTAPLSYQWYFNTNFVLAGATSASLTITNVQTNNAGGYTVVVSNSVASITSAVATLTVVSAPVGGGNIYVATNGLDANPGTLAQPTTLTKAITLVQPGGTIYLRGGTYVYSVQITLDRTNTGAGEFLRKRMFAYPAEQPVLDFSSQPYGDTSSVSNPRGLQINGHWWHIKGLEVKGSADNGIYVAGNSNIVELCITHHNRDSGLQIARYASTAAHPEWPAYNLVLNCDSYDNYDSPPNGGENADGFACKLTSGPGNVFRGCVAHHNVDDGWDLFAKSETGPIDPVTIDQCVAYANGVLSDGTINANGDRNGFKLGGSSIAVNHIVTRSIAFSNLHNGFTWNSNPGEIRMVNNLAFDNTLGNFKFDVEGPIFINNLSFWKSLASDQSDRHGVSGSPATPSNCWWDKSKAQPSINSQGLIVTAADFISLVPPAGGFTRNLDGSVNLGTFGKLSASSPLIDAGDVPVLPNPGELPFDPGTYYLGDPDIGAVESGP